MFNLHAAILYNGQARLLRTLCCFVVANAQLEPEHPGSNSNSFIGNRWDILSFAEDIDDFDLLSCLFRLGQRGIDALAQYSLSGITRIDRNDIVALGLQVDRHEVTGAIGISGDADDSDVVILLDNLQTVIHVRSRYGHSG